MMPSVVLEIWGVLGQPALGMARSADAARLGDLARERNNAKPLRGPMPLRPMSGSCDAAGGWFQLIDIYRRALQESRKGAGSVRVRCYDVQS